MRNDTYVINEAATVNQNRAFATKKPETPDASRLKGASRQVKKLTTLERRAMR